MDHPHKPFVRSKPSQDKGRRIEIPLLTTIGRGVVDPATPESVNRLPDLLRKRAANLLDPAARLRGKNVVVLEVKDEQRLWLDKEMHFAIRQRDFLRQGKLAVRAECSEFNEVAPNEWIPRRITRTFYGDDRQPTELQGKPYLRLSLVVTSLEANQPGHNSYLDRLGD